MSHVAQTAVPESEPAERSSSPSAPTSSSATAGRALPQRQVVTAFDRSLAGAVLQRSTTKEPGWLDSLWDTVGDALETVGSTLERLRELSEYPICEHAPPRPDLGAWFDSKGLQAIRNRKGLLSRSKLPRGDRGAAALVRQAVQAWGAETYGRDLLPQSGATGKFDAEAAEAIKQLQRYAGLTVDGVVGPKTLAVIDAYVMKGDGTEAEDEIVVDEAGVDPRSVPIVDGFSEMEQIWIRQVWALPEIQALFGLYPSIPRPILTRVDKIVSAKDGSLTGAAGIHREGGEHVEIADNTYNQPEGWNVSGSDEAQFKTVLIHELFHVFEYWSEDHDAGGLKLKTPSELVADMVTLELGWFIHPNAESWGPDVQQECHFSWGALQAPGDYYLPPYSALYQTMMDPSRWEASPDNRGAEEDVSTCLGMFLGSEESHDHLQDAFPRRYELISTYVEELRRGAEGAI